MTAQLYKQSLALVLAHEGGYVNHPKDPGGATNKGVTQAVYDAYRKVNGLATQSVRYIADDEVGAIYQKQYWKLVRGDSLPAGLDYAVFDFAVNSGVSRANKYLQRLIGLTGDDVDGLIGNQTLAAVYEKAKQNEEALIAGYCANRMAFLKSLGTFPTFGKGWTRRVIGYTPGAQDNDSGVIDYAMKFARGDLEYQMPSAIGSKPDEIPAKAIAPAVEMPIVPPADLKSLVEQNDLLALKVALSKVG